jgi:hypothetical protein
MVLFSSSKNCYSSLNTILKPNLSYRSYTSKNDNNSEIKDKILKDEVNYELPDISSKVQSIANVEEYIDIAVTTTIAVGTAATASVFSKAPTSITKATTLIGGSIATASSAVIVKATGNLLINTLNRASDTLEDNNRAPSSSDVGVSDNFNIKSPFELNFDFFYLWNLADSNPEKTIIICSLLLTGLSLFFFIAIFFNYLGRKFTPLLESKLKSKILINIVKFNNRLSIKFFYYYFFMIFFTNFFTFFGLFVLLISSK